MSRHDSREIENVKVMLVKGDSGSTIVSIEKTGTSGLVDTYTITMSDGSKSTFTVSNGKEIVSVEKTGTSGLVDTYTMTFNDESTETFEVINGNGIASIEKTGTQGAVDTYTITLDDGTTYTFTVTNATGTVDSELSTTSENPVENRVITNKINAMDDNIAGTENGATASQTYVAGEFILRNNQLYKVTTAIATGDALTVGVNISTDSVGEELQQINADVEQINSDLSNQKVTPKLLDASKSMQCDTVYLQSYAYTAQKKCVISITVKGLFNNGYCTGVKFYVNGALMLTEEHDNQAVSYSYMLNAGDTFVVHVRYSNYTINEIDQRGFILEFG